MTWGEILAADREFLARPPPRRGALGRRELLDFVVRSKAGTKELPKETPEVVDLEHRAVVRDVILWTAVVIVMSLAVPTWIMHAEYRKGYDSPVTATPAAEVLRERASGTAVITLQASDLRDIPELAERLVRQETERRAMTQAAKPRSTPGPVRPAASRPAETAAPVAPVVDTPRFNSRQSSESP